MTFLVCALLVGFQAPSATYVANEGVMISGKAGAVLLDAFHYRGNSLYKRVDELTLLSMRTAEPPYDNVRLILVSHNHADHFDARSIADHLRANDQAVLVAPTDVAQAVGGFLPNIERGRIRPLYPPEGAFSETRINGVKLTVMNLPHGTGRFASIQNVGFVIDIDGTRWLHVGDAEANRAVYEAYAPRLRNIDVALLPFWYVLQDEGRVLIDEVLKPKKLVAYHVPRKEVADVEQKVGAVYPNALVLGEPGQLFSPAKD